MRLDRVDITAIRNLERVNLRDLAQINVLYGANGSGKTSVLESLYLLGMARSFRTPHIKTLITRGQESCTVYAERLADKSGQRLAIGVSRDLASNYQIRLGGRTVTSIAELAGTIPVLCLTADSFGVFLGGPAVRRKFLDWSVFHVEHGFYPAWKKYQRCIKHRNTLLRRDKLDSNSIAVWSAELAGAGEVLDTLRQKHFEGLKPLFEEIAKRLSPDLAGLEIRYNRGWDSTRALADVLAESVGTEFERGFTQAGPHRADLKFRLEGGDAAAVLSRGQMKLAVCAMTLAQGRLVGKMTRQSCLYLVDDLPSELDQMHRASFCEILSELQTQVFITAVDAEDLRGFLPPGDRVKVFHVEHGAVTPEISLR